MLRSGSSYLSQSELVLTFGLGAQTKADSVEIQWPSGQVDKLSNVNAGQTDHGRGRERHCAQTRPYAKAIVRKMICHSEERMRRGICCPVRRHCGRISVYSVFPVISVVKSLIR